jgi:hypothetical protein
MLEATVFTMHTDHKSLTFAFQQRSDKASARQLRQLDFIGQFSTRIVHLPGNSNTVANALSRIEEITAGTIFDNEELAVAQETDPELKQLLDSESTGLHLKQFTAAGANRPLLSYFIILLLLNYSVKYNKNSNRYVCTNSGVGTCAS